MTVCIHVPCVCTMSTELSCVTGLHIHWHTGTCMYMCTCINIAKVSERVTLHWQVYHKILCNALNGILRSTMFPKWPNPFTSWTELTTQPTPARRQTTLRPSLSNQHGCNNLPLLIPYKIRHGHMSLLSKWPGVCVCVCVCVCARVCVSVCV